MIRTGWLPSALGPGGEHDEAVERYGIEAEIRSCPPEQGGYWEVRIIGELQNVVKAISGWWETGDDHEDLEFLKLALADCETYDPARAAAVAELAEATKAVNAACAAEIDAGRARLAANARFVEAREALAKIDG